MSIRRDSSMKLAGAIDALASVSTPVTNSNFFDSQAMKRELEKSRRAVELADSINKEYAQEFADNLVNDDLIAKARAMRQRRNSR